MYLFGAIVFSIAERAMRSILWINSLDQIMSTKNSSFIEMGGQFFISSALLMVRYLMCSRRHIWAYKAGFIKRNSVLKRVQKKWLCNTSIMDRNAVFKTTHNMKLLGEYTEEEHARIAIDIIPGYVSILIGLFQIYRYVTYPMSFICILYLFLLEYIYNIYDSSIEKDDDVAYKTIITDHANMYSSIGESIQNKGLVFSFGRYGYEMERVAGLLEKCFDNEMNRTTIYNTVCSMKHWASHLVYIGIMILSKDHIEKGSHIVWVLYFAKEIRSGCQEIHNYNHIANKRISIMEEIDVAINVIEPYVPVEKTKYVGEISLNSLSLSYGKKVIFDKKTFTDGAFEKNKYTIITGPNGIGKSSLCKILCGYITPFQNGDSNQIVCIPEPGNIIVCEQKPLFFESKTVLYNISYATDDIYNDAYLDKKEKYRKMCSKLNMERFIDNDVTISSLSGGERAKVSVLRAYARSIERKIDLIVVDEWEAFLDKESREKGLDIIEEMRKSHGCAVVWVTHGSIKTQDNYVLVEMT